MAYTGGSALPRHLKRMRMTSTDIHLRVARNDERDQWCLYHYSILLIFDPLHTT